MGDGLQLPQVAGDEFYLEERYRGEVGCPPHVSTFYAIKPLLPRWLQMKARRRLARRRARQDFPAWPMEDILERRRAEAVRVELEQRDLTRLPFVNYWPDRSRFAFVLTHDVEGTLGVSRIPDVLEVERRHGILSSWNFVAEDYAVTEADRALVREAGCEVGLHGISHDGRLFRSRAGFESQLPKIARYLEEWDVVGFRSPSTLRNSGWMHELPCLYDSSFPHSDPFQPQRGGCLSIFPFFFGDVVELPITLDQDYTLFELLAEPDIGLWTRKSDWIIGHHGLINVIVHPDYMTPDRLERYERFLIYLKSQAGGWHALPREVAEWWKARAGVVAVDGEAVEGDPTGRATVAHARLEDGRVVYDV